MLHNFKELKIWIKSMSLVKSVLLESKRFPEEYKYSLTSQIVRSAISIPSNIAEGSARSTTKDFRRFLDIAQGSACELETQLMISRDVEIIEPEVFTELVNKLNELQKMIRGFKASIS